MRSAKLALLCALSGALPALPARAQVDAAEGAAPDAATQAPAPAARPSPQPIGYVTDHGNRLPLLQYEPYQAARRRWLAGFCTTLSSAAIFGTGVGVMLVGGYGGGLTDDGRHDALVAGGVLLGLGAAGTAVGAVLWHLGRKEISLIERGLPPHVTSVGLSPLPGGAAAAMTLSF